MMFGTAWQITRAASPGTPNPHWRGDRMGDDGETRRRVDGKNLVQPVLRILLRVPHRDQVDAARRREQEQAIYTGLLGIERARHASFGGEIEDAAEHGHLAAGLIDRNLGHTALLLASQVIDFAGFRISDDPAHRAKAVLEKVPDHVAIGPFIHFAVPIERQYQRGVVTVRQIGHFPSPSRFSI
jgi:hypothetical protein